MSSDDSTPQPSNPDRPVPDPRLQSLEPLVGGWLISGDAHGETSFEWMDGGFFLVQRGWLTKGGSTHNFVEYIGLERGFGAAALAVDITSRVYTTEGDTLDYTYEADGKSVTIWGGAKGSPAAYRARWNDEMTILTGAWEWPGGGYTAIMTRR